MTEVELKKNKMYGSPYSSIGFLRQKEPTTGKVRMDTPAQIPYLEPDNPGESGLSIDEALAVAKHKTRCYKQRFPYKSNFVCETRAAKYLVGKGFRKIAKNTYMNENRVFAQITKWVEIYSKSGYIISYWHEKGS